MVCQRLGGGVGEDSQRGERIHAGLLEASVPAIRIRRRVTAGPARCGLPVGRERLRELGLQSSGGHWRGARRQAETLQDGAGRVGRMDRGEDPRPPAAVRALRFAGDVRPMWGLTPFNSYLFTFRRVSLPD